MPNWIKLWNLLRRDRMAMYISELELPEEDLPEQWSYLRVR